MRVPAPRIMAKARGEHPRPRLLRHRARIAQDARGRAFPHLRLAGDIAEGRAYATVAEARASIGRHLGWYVGSRPHSSLDRRTLDQADFNDTPLLAAA